MTECLTDIWENHSISHGTLIIEDLIEKCLDFLETVGPGLGLGESDVEDLKKDFEQLTGILEYITRRMGSTSGHDTSDVIDSWASEQLFYLYNEDIDNLMQEIAPPGCYFGSHPGDGSDIGFWRVEED
jgi:hypothetical protein